MTNSNHTEIERRFLLDKQTIELIKDFPNLGIQQGYLVSTPDKQTLRVRVVTEFTKSGKSGEKKGTECFLTYKSGTGIQRKEVEEKITLDMANSLLDMSQFVIWKRRFCVAGWELDYFMGLFQDFALAEKELKSVDEEIMPPQGITLGREVTDILTNYHLGLIALQVRRSSNPLDSELAMRLLQDHLAGKDVL